MKKLIGALVLGLVGALLFAQPIPPQPNYTTWNFSWEHSKSTNYGLITYRIFFATNLATPSENRTLVYITTNNSATIPMSVPMGFFSMTASNLQGTGSFTEAVWVPAPIDPAELGLFTVTRKD